MDEHQFKEVIDRLDAISKIPALQLPAGLKMSQRIRLLRQTGLSYGQIERIVGKPTKYVSATVLKQRKGKGKEE